jgi:2-iminobutanoate/2-iminopropanoate deaminase
MTMSAPARRRDEVHVPSRPVLSHAADAVRAAGLVFVAGILPVDAAGVLVGEDDVETQAEHVLSELRAVLGAAGCSTEDVASLAIYLVDLADHDAVAAVQRRVFGAVRPASTAVEVTGLAVRGARIEVDAVAVAP